MDDICISTVYVTVRSPTSLLGEIVIYLAISLRDDRLIQARIFLNCSRPEVTSRGGGSTRNLSIQSQGKGHLHHTGHFASATLYLFTPM